jgi:PilZ domain
MAAAPANSRRWPRHQVKLPVRIITADEASEITVPGLTTEISQGGMALYGGVPLQPGDLMEVEFQTSNRLRVAASVRDRNGYCFGLEFLGLLPNENASPGGTAEVESLVSSGKPVESPIGVIKNEDQILALFLKRHEAYLRQKEMDIKRWRYEIEEIRQSRREIEMLVLCEVLGHSR